jgi:hypothetical protein
MAHAIRIRYDSNASNKLDEFNSWLDEWAQADGLREYNRPPTPFSGDVKEPSFWYAELRLDDNEDLQAALNDLHERMFAGVKWYLVETHDCAQDRETGECDGWTVEKERGNVPDSLR